MRNILRIEDKSEEDDPTVKPPPSFSVRVMKTAAEYSDVLVFDFLADDYDRMGKICFAAFTLPNVLSLIYRYPVPLSGFINVSSIFFYLLLVGRIT